MFDIRLDPETDRVKLKEKNLEAFEQWLPEVWPQLTNYSPQTELCFDETGQPDVLFQGKKFYDGQYYEYVDTQLRKFSSRPSRIRLGPLQADEFDGVSRHFFDQFMSRSTSDGEVNLARYRQSDTSFYTIVLGAGLCGHLPEVAKRTKCQNLFLIEPNWELIHHSLEVFDWAAFLEEFLQQGGDIFFLTSTNSEDIFDFYRFRTRVSNPSSLDGTNIYTHYSNPLFVDFSQKIMERAQLLVSGLGFFVDENLMIQNCKLNLESGTARLYKKRHIVSEENTPVFIIGSGPSIDEQFDYIKALQDNAIIVSCGTGLGPLLNAGITPDFHVEMENIGVSKTLAFVTEKHDVSDICLVSASTVEPDIAPAFSEVIYYFRPALCPYPVFSGLMDHCLLNIDPTVVNTGLSFCLANGFRQIYLFGVDMGQRRGLGHHSKGAYHYSDDAQIKEKNFNIEVPANFGGKAYTFNGLAWARDTIEKAIRGKPHRTEIINCSDGAQIVGARPVLARKLSLTAPKRPKAETVRNLIDVYPIYTREAFEERWKPNDLKEALDRIYDDISDLLDVDRIDSFDFMYKLGTYVRNRESTADEFAAIVYRGTLYQLMIIVDYYVPRARDDAQSAKMAEIAKEEFLIALATMRDETKQTIDSILEGKYRAYEELKHLSAATRQQENVPA